MSNLPTIPSDDNNSAPQSPFEQIKRVDPDGIEFWSARDLMPLLEYASWQNFKRVLLRAQVACEKSHHTLEAHFVSVHKDIENGAKNKHEIEDLHLSRFACYLVVQNADPSKKVVARCQTYLALQTRRQEERHISNFELAANWFRSTQAEDKIRRDNVQGKDNANQVHFQAGQVVRRAIAELGGTMPEDLPTAESIKKLEREQKKRLAAGNKRNSEE